MPYRKRVARGSVRAPGGPVPNDLGGLRLVAVTTREFRMSSPRNLVRLDVSARQPRTFDAPRLPDGHRAPVSSYFGRHALDLIKLRERLPREVYNALVSTLRHGT